MFLFYTIMLGIMNQNIYQRPNNLSFRARVGNPINFPSNISKAIMDGKIPDFFVPTPKDVTRFMINEVGGISANERVLEPSAGYGHIIDSVLSFSEGRRTNIDAIEPIEILRANLVQKGVNIVGLDIMQYNPGPIYDKILMNPPFYEGVDISHVLHCYKLLKPGGKLATILPDAAFIPLKHSGFEYWERDWFNDGHSTEINEHLRSLLSQRNVKSKIHKLNSAFLQSNVPDDIQTRLVVIERNF